MSNLTEEQKQEILQFNKTLDRIEEACSEYLERKYPGWDIHFDSIDTIDEEWIHFTSEEFLPMNGGTETEWHKIPTSRIFGNSEEGV